MGRPLNKRYFGPPTAGGNEIKVQFNSGSGSTPGYIVKQTGSKRFNVSNAGGTVTGTCYLVDKASAALAAGEMSIVVDDNGTSRQVVKIAGRTVTLDNGSKIKWDFTGTGATVEIEEAGTDANMTGADDIEGDG